MYSFIPKKKSDKLMHLVGFILRIYHDARSPERQKTTYVLHPFHKIWNCVLYNANFGLEL